MDCMAFDAENRVPDFGETAGQSFDEKVLFAEFTIRDCPWKWYVAEAQMTGDGSWDFYGLIVGFLEKPAAIVGPSGALLVRWWGYFSLRDLIGFGGCQNLKHSPALSRGIASKLAAQEPGEMAEFSPPVRVTKDDGSVLENFEMLSTF